MLAHNRILFARSVAPGQVTSVALLRHVDYPEYLGNVDT